MRNVMNVSVSLFQNRTSTTPKTVNLYEWLISDEYRTQIEKIRNCDSEQEKKDLKALLPAITPSGVFTVRKADSIQKHSGFICIDIDKKDNLDVDNFSDLKSLIKDLEYVAYCGLSASGEGCLALIPITASDKHREHFRHLQCAFANSGIKIDASCSDVSRLRFASYDDKPYINLEAKPYDKYLSNVNKPMPKANIAPHSNQKTKERVENLLDNLELLGIDMTEDYPDWLEIGFSIANEFGESGRDYFHRVSQFNPKYDVDEANKKYSSCLNSKPKNDESQITIATLFYHAQKHGVIQSAIEKDFDININRS